MRLYDEMFSSEQAAAKCVWALGDAAYCTGVKSVGEFSPERLTLHFPKGRLELVGEGLSIGKFCDGDVSLRGKIRELRYVDDRERTE